MKTKNLTFVAICAAIAVIMLYGASILPTGRASLLVIASLTTALVVVRCGILPGICLYTITGVLALILLPEKTAALFWCLFFGHYGVLKSLIERLDSPVFCWALKIALFNICAAGLYLIWKIFMEGELPISPIWVFGAGNILFIVYDVLFTGLIFFIVKRTRLTQGK